MPAYFGGALQLKERLASLGPRSGVHVHVHVHVLVLVLVLMLMLMLMLKELLALQV